VPPRSKLEFAGGVWKDSDLYIDQLRYVNKMVESAIDDILKRSPSEPIIVIQGDHGPSYAGDATSSNPSQRFIFERTGILNVYYLPKHCRSDLYPSISPVNTFRVVFACLGVDFQLLEDRTYWKRAEPPIDYSQMDRR
jgi:hypothetical protein